MQTKLENDKNICAVILEPIQGEAGIRVPNKDYLTKVAKLCKKHNVLFIADEVQTGFGRTGKLMAYEHDDCKPDILCLGKSISGGLVPVSAALANDNIMMCIKPGEHGSTFGGYHLGMAVAKTAV
jgi:ornithine--oxo-acid transaminase